MLSLKKETKKVDLNKLKNLTLEGLMKSYENQRKRNAKLYDSLDNK